MDKMMEILRPYPFAYTEDKDVYGKVRVTELTFYEDCETAHCKVEISLINERMLEYDTVFAQEQILSDAHPYFYEFDAEMDMCPELLIELLGGNTVNGVYIPTPAQFYEMNTICAVCDRYSEYYKFLIMNSICNHDDDYRWGNECDSYLYKKFRFVDEAEKNEDPLLVIGMTLFSASPIIKQRTALKVIGASDDEISRVVNQIKSNFKGSLRCIYNKKDYKYVQDALNRTFSSYDPAYEHKVTVYNVGQGNLRTHTHELQQPLQQHCGKGDIHLTFLRVL